MDFLKNQRVNTEYNDIPKSDSYKFDVAISYDSHCKELVKEVAMYLKSEKFEVFFDEDERLEILSENLKAKLYQIYQNESLIKVLFITDRYLKSEYTLLEARRSLISVKENHRRLIIINLIGIELPEPYSNFAYLDGNLPTDEIAYTIGERIKELKNNYACKVKPPKASAGAKTYIENINLIEQNRGNVAGNNATFHKISFHD